MGMFIFTKDVDSVLLGSKKPITTVMFLVPYSGNTGAMTLQWKTTVDYPVPRAISFYWKDVTHPPINELSAVFTPVATVALASVDDSPMSGESDPAYDRLMQQFAELDEEYRRVGILSD